MSREYTPEQLERLRASMLYARQFQVPKPLSEEHRKKLSISHQGKKHSPERREKCCAALEKARAVLAEMRERGEL